MTTGGKLTVANAASDGRETFTVTLSRNVEITNYTDRKMGKVGDIHTQVKNGRNGTTSKVYSNGTDSQLRSLDLNSKRYAIFDALRKLDKNENDLSEQDLAKAKSLIGKYGIKAVRQDAKAGVTTIVCDDGAVLKFDFETDAEMKAREQQEAAAKKKESTPAQPQKEEGFFDKLFNLFK